MKEKYEGAGKAFEEARMNMSKAHRKLRDADRRLEEAKRYGTGMYC